MKIKLAVIALIISFYAQASRRRLTHRGPYGRESLFSCMAFTAAVSPGERRTGLIGQT